MSRYAGVMRDAEGLAELLQVIGQAGSPSGSMASTSPVEVLANEQEGLDLEAVEGANLRMVCLLIAAGALRRAESRGCHRRRDATGTAAAPRHTLVRWDGQQFVVSKEAL